ncbi:MAG: transglycosylase SLT domain-containing protein, partial [Verrucomicrobia bacterium]|nr:transglycosylase SLT domain-containing protein [Verrucomicrobiota bacterium]
PENIYNVTSSPVKEVPELLATQSMATQFLDTLKVKYKKDPNKAKAAKTATPPAGAAVSGAAAVAAAAVPQKAQANKAVGQPAQAKTLGTAGAILVGSASMADSVGNVSPLETVMLKAMGLVDMDPGKISTLHSLTKDVLEEIAVNKNKAEYKGLVDPMYRKFSGAFGCDSEDQAQYEFFKKWFTFRYMPVLVNAISCILKNGGKKEDVLSLSTVAGKVAYETANAVKSSLCGGEMGSVPVWNSPYSPWPNYVLNATLSSVEGNIAALKNSLSANTIKEVTAKENPAKSKTAIEALTERFKAMKDKAAGLLQDGMQAAKDAGNYVKDGAVNLGNKAGELVSEAGSAMKEGAYNLAGNLGFDGGTIGGHVGKGTGGDINSIPEPKGPEGKWASIKDMILAVSKMTGVDPNLMAAVAAKESSFKWNVKAETSSATGLYQFIRSTWDTMLKRYGSKYGIAPGTSPKDPRANALMGAEFIRENSKAIQSVKPGGLSPTDLYIAHFLGAAGAKKFFQAGQNAIGAVIFPEAAKANKSVFYDNGRPRSLGEIYQIFRSNIEGTMKKMGLGNGVGAAEAPPPGVPTSVNNAPLPPANPGKETSPAVAGGAAPVPQKAQAKPAAGIVPIAPVPSNQPSIPAQQVQAPSAGVVSSPAVQQRTVQDNKIQQDAYTALVASNKAISDTLNASLAEHKTHTGLLREIAASLGKAANQAGELSKGANKSMKDQFKKTTEMTAPPVSMAKGVM